MTRTRLVPLFLLIAITIGVDAHARGRGAALRVGELQAEFERLVRGVDGRIGACAQDRAGVACVNGDQRSSLQSVMKLVVGIAVFEKIDRGEWRAGDTVVVRREDLSVFVQPIAQLVTPDGYRTTIDDLVRRAIVDSDSAATDTLLAKLGGPAVVQAMLDRHKIAGMRIDRDERHLQTESQGLTWKPEYVDSDVLNRAIEALPPGARDAAYRKYQKDPRDTSSPRAMAALLHALASGKLVSPASTKRLMDIMVETVTFPNRLKAGVTAPGWTLGHKTGTSGAVQGVVVATNDVGILTAPDGTHIAIAVFVSDSRGSEAERAAVMVKMARATINAYR